MTTAVSAVAPAAAAGQDPSPRRRGRLRTFIAWSLFLHAGAGVAWGLPAWLSKSAEMELEQSMKGLAEHQAKEAVKAKENAHEQHIEQTRREVETRLKSEFAKLASRLSEAEREKLWQKVAERTKPETTAFAEALSDPDISADDLRSKEAELEKDVLDAADQVLTAGSTQELAERFLAQVDNQVAPDLARWMRQEIRDQVAQQMRSQADQLVREQREAANRQREASLAASRAAEAKLREADETAKRERNDASKSAKRMQEAGQRLQEAGAQLATAQQQSPDLGAAAKQGLDAAQTAVTKAQAATTAAAAAATAAAAAPSDQAAKDAAGASAQAADQAIAAARQAAKSAGEAVAKGADAREQEVRGGLKLAGAEELRSAIEKSFTDEFNANTVPRLGGKLAEEFRAEMEANGIKDEALAAEVAKKAAAILAAKVPALVAAGGEVEDKFKSLAREPASGTPAASANSKRIALGNITGTTGDTTVAAGGGAGSAQAPSSPSAQTEQDRKLAEGAAKIAADAAGKLGGLAKNAARDDALVKRAGQGSGEAGEAQAEVRDRVARMAEGMRNGRVGEMGGAEGLSGLRRGGSSRGGSGSPGTGRLPASSAVADKKIYEAVAAQIADRGVVQGVDLSVTGSEGAAAHAVRAAGQVPAQTAGADNAKAESTSSNTQPYQPTFKSLAFASVPYLPGDFTLDGRAEKWAGIPPIALKPEQGPDQSAQSMQIGWRSDGLYCRFTIADPDRRISKTKAGNFWDGDTIEVWVDSFNTKEKYRSRHAGQQFWLWPDGAADDPSITGGESIIESRKSYWVPTPLKADALPRVTTMTPDGYIMEFRLSPALLPDAEFLPGRILGLNAYVTTKSTTNWYWSAGKDARTYTQPDTWGDLLLAGSDAKLELGGKPTNSKPQVLIPGQPVKLTVTDGDMDLSPAKRDKVMVTLKPAHGGSQMAVLEETGDATGVFEGSVGTALALGDEQGAGLAVYEGEKVSAMYLDQARANGARNAEVTLTLQFGAVLTAGR